MNVVNYIAENGITMYFWNHPNKYIYLDGHHYWVMRNGEDDPTTIINRCYSDENKYSMGHYSKIQNQNTSTYMIVGYMI